MWRTSLLQTCLLREQRRRFVVGDDAAALMPAVVTSMAAHCTSAYNNTILPNCRRWLWTVTT